MQQNVGETDRIARIVLGVILAAVAVAGFTDVLSLGVGPLSAPLGAAIVGVIGLVLVATGATRTCGLYRALGIDTRES